MAFTLFLLSLLATTSLAQLDGFDGFDRPDGFGDAFGDGNDFYDDDYRGGYGGSGGRRGRKIGVAHLTDDNDNHLTLDFMQEDAPGAQGPGLHGPAGFGHALGVPHLNFLSRHGQQSQANSIRVSGVFTSSEHGEKMQGKFSIYITEYGVTDGHCLGLGPILTNSDSHNQGQHGLLGQRLPGIFGHSPYSHFGHHGGYGGHHGHFSLLGNRGHSPYGPQRPRRRYVGVQAKLNAYNHATLESYLTENMDLDKLYGHGVTVCAESPYGPTDQRQPCKFRTSMCGSIQKARYTTEEFKAKLKHLEFQQAYKQQQANGGGHPLLPGQPGPLGPPGPTLVGGGGGPPGGSLFPSTGL